MLNFMKLMKRIVPTLVLFALADSTGGVAYPVHARNKKKENVVVELRIKGFSEPILVKVPLDGLMGTSVAGGQDHYPDEIPGGYFYSVSAQQLRRNRASIAISVTLTYRGGAKKQVNGRMLVTRNKPSEAEYENGVKVKAYFEAAPNNSFNASGNSAAFNSNLDYRRVNWGVRRFVGTK
jgi:hypothetical protein